MKALVLTASGYALFMALAAGVSELYFAPFSVSALMLGASALAAGVSGIFCAIRGRAGWLAAASSLVGLGAVVADVVDFQTRPHAPGNSYGWVFAGPLCVAFAVIAFAGVRQAIVRRRAS
jgi:hypothetical protein